MVLWLEPSLQNQTDRIYFSRTISRVFSALMQCHMLIGCSIPRWESSVADGPLVCFCSSGVGPLLGGNLWRCRLLLTRETKRRLTGRCTPSPRTWSRARLSLTQLHRGTETVLISRPTRLGGQSPQGCEPEPGTRGQVTGRVRTRGGLQAAGGRTCFVLVLFP